MTHSFRARRRQVVRLGVAAGLVAALAGCDGGGNAGFRATDITGLDLGRDLALEDHEGRSRTLSDFAGKVVVVFFGFIQCPDVCSMTLTDLSQVMRSLGQDADGVQVLFVTVDPERDNQVVLSQYVTYFDPRFLGMRGAPSLTGLSPQIAPH